MLRVGGGGTRSLRLLPPPSWGATPFHVQPPFNPSLTHTHTHCAEGLKLNLAYDVAKRNPSAVVTLNRSVRGADAQLRATYRRAGDVLILDQQWKLDKATTLAGSYNFASEEAAVSLTRTHGPWTAHGAYNFAKDAVLLDVKRKSGPDTVGVTYQPREDAATLHWSRKPIRVSGWFGGGGGAGCPSPPHARRCLAVGLHCPDSPPLPQASLRASNISGRPAFSNLSASIVATHEFNL